MNGWNDAIAAYVTAMKAADRAEGTVRLHRHYLAQLREVHDDPWAVTLGDLQELMGRSSWGSEARKSARSVFRGFYRWAHGVGLLEEDPALGLAPVRVSPGVPRPTPEILVKRLTRAQDRRVGFMAMLAAYAGLRAGEIARVHQNDLVGDELLVHGKGRKQRAVPIVQPTLLAELRLVKGWAFPNGLGGHLSPGHVSRLMSREMPPGWTCHSLRHRMASQAYAGTRDLLAVQQLLGHSRPETTQRYVQLPDDALRTAARSSGVRLTCQALTSTLKARSATTR